MRQRRGGPPAYAGKASVNLRVGLSVSYGLTRNGSLFGGVGYTRLGSGIADSPIVIHDSVTAPVAGALWVEPLTLKRPVPMCYITGNADPLNLIGGGMPKLASGASDSVRAKPKPPVRDSILKWVKALGCPAAPISQSNVNGVRTETYCAGRAEVVYITVNDLGHTWAGGKSLLPERTVGKTSDKIKATDVIWGFFQKHAGAVAGKKVSYK